VALMSYVENQSPNPNLPGGQQGQIVLEVAVEPVHAAEPGAVRTVSGDHAVADLHALAYEWSEVAADDRCVRCAEAAALLEV
jgi:hypothetical protein